MILKKAILMILAVFSTVFVGCQENSEIAIQKPVCLAATNDQAINAAKKVLRDMHFVIEKSDADAGYIRTRPLSGAEFFEFWRTDAADSRKLAESSLHSIQRIVEINISPAQEKVQVDCAVKTRRLALTGREISGFSDLPRMFSKSKASQQSLEMQKDVKSKRRWIDTGADSGLEAKILTAINKEIRSR